MQNIIEQIKQKVQEKFTTAKGSHDWDHTERVYNTAVSLGEKMQADLDIIKLAAILHDIARPEQDESSGQLCHAELGAQMAGEILKEFELDDRLIEKIVHCIACHRFRKNNVPQTLEAQIIYDADKLDAIGAIGLGRAFSFSGEVGAKVHVQDPDLNVDTEYTDQDCAYREYLVKLGKIKDKMLTEEGRRIAQGRHEFMKDFFEQINSEVNGLR